MYEITNVKESHISNKYSNNNKRIIEVSLVSRYVEYIMDKDSKKIISGNDENRIEKIIY